jgi:hypothetical protein
MENHVRIYRGNPIAWWDKPVMRYLRNKYGHDKKSFVFIRSVYLAICEIESDFSDKPVNSFNKTVGTYAGVSREVAGKYINLLIKEKLLAKTRTIDPKTKRFLQGTIIQILTIRPAGTSSEPVSAYPSNGSPQRWDTQAPLKKISSDKKLSFNNNVAKKAGRLKEAPTRSQEEIEYYAEALANKLNDRKSLSYYKAACRMYEPTALLQKAAEIVADGGARKPGAVFVDWLKKQQAAS